MWGKGRPFALVPSAVAGRENWPQQRRRQAGAYSLYLSLWWMAKEERAQRQTGNEDDFGQSFAWSHLFSVARECRGQEQ